MTIECFNVFCRKHSNNNLDGDESEGPVCHEPECKFEPMVPGGYTSDELDADNPYLGGLVVEEEQDEDQSGG